MNAIIRAVDRLPDNETEAISPTIQGLQGMMAEINNELEQLRSACPADWSPSRNVIDDKMSELHATLKSLSQKVGGPLIPDSLMWVSE